MIGFSLMAAATLLGAGLIFGRRHPRAWLVLTLLGCLAALAATVPVLCVDNVWEWWSSFPVGGELMHLRLDALSAGFLALLAIIGATGAVYSTGYWSDAEKPASAPQGRVWWNALILSMGLVLLCSNGLHFLIAWEAFAVCAYFLITLDKKRREVRAAGWLYLGASHAGTLLLFAFFALLAARTHSWDLGPGLHDQADLAPLFWFALVGFGVKAGLFPLHVWLPSAHANAPSHVSAMMSCVAIKMGIYGILRFSGWLTMPAAAGWVVISLGAITAILGAAFALAQNDLKRLLAYCSIENIGIILTGLGGALLARNQGNAAWGQLALIGCLLHVINHGLFKGVLFFGAGSVMHATGTREMSRLGGLWKSMPWTAAFFAFAAAAISALPPLNGFISEWFVYQGLFNAVTARGTAAWAAMPAIVLVAMTGALALATFVKAGAVMFLGAPRTKPAMHAHECGRPMRFGMISLVVGCLIVSFAPGLFWGMASRAAEVWNPVWVPAPATTSLVVLGLFNAILMALIAFVALRVWRHSTQNGLERNLTWDCGYAVPTARMQYTGGSVARTASGWFDWILQPVTKLRRPRGHNPEVSYFAERIPETVLEKVLGPVAAGVVAVSTNVRRLQHGRLQFYILYLLAGLFALGALIFLGVA